MKYCVDEDMIKEIYNEEIKRRMDRLGKKEKISFMNKDDLICYINDTNIENYLIEDFHFYVNKEVLEDFDIQLLIYKNNNNFDVFNKNKNIFENKELILKIIKETIFENQFDKIINNLNGKLNNENFLLKLCRNYKGNKEMDYLLFNTLESNFDIEYINYLKSYSDKSIYDNGYTKYLKITDCIKYTKKYIDYKKLKNKCLDNINEDKPITIKRSKI